MRTFDPGGQVRPRGLGAVGVQLPGQCAQRQVIVTHRRKPEARGAVGDLLRGRLLELAGPQAARAYLAHLVLRQADWWLRFHPAAAATRRHLHLARLVTHDIDDGPGPAH
jgi:hypothetical protein